ncbi:MAG: TonB-dependent receptor [Bacteroidales bacterium]|nr:TonB-dependent receptor [Bacteroidales bacterium]
MKKLLIFPFLLVLSLLSVSVMTQQVTVLDRSDLQPIDQVSVTNQSHNYLVVTNTLGKIDISGFEASDTLFFTHIAFQPYITTKKELSRPDARIYLTEHIIRLDEFVISANRTQQKKSDLPYKIETISAKDIQFDNPQTSAQMLEQTGEVFIQQSQMGGGSPVLRGLEANRVLLVLDGVRLNNAIYRGGHLQNVITVDPSLLRSTEILFGPGSVIYGSDALGGVITLQTFDPVLSDERKAMIRSRVYGRFASANIEKSGGFRLNVGLKKWGFLTAFTYSNFGDLRQGRSRNPFYGSFGERLFFAERIDGKDSMVINDKPWIQKPSGYSQYSLLQKVLFAPSSDLKFTLNVQYSNSSDIPRYDRLTDTVNGQLKYAEWYYGPQERLFASIKGSLTNANKIYDNATIILAYQQIREERINRRFGKKDKKFNMERVDLFSLYGDFRKRLSQKDELQYGISADLNLVGSKAYSEDITTRARFYNVPTRYPDKKAQMFNVAAYLSNVWKISSVFTFSQGIRYTYVSLSAAWSDTILNIMQFPFSSSVVQDNHAVNGYLGWVAHPGYDWKISLIASSGFRAPNIDDIGKVNDSNSQDQLLIVPNPGLKPEAAYNLELSLAKTFEKSLRLELTGYYTWLTDAIVLRPFQYNGQDSIQFDGVLCQVQANTNAGRAHIYGAQGSLRAQVTRTFSITSNLTYTCGRVRENNIPLDHIPPVFGMTSFKLELRKFKGDFYVMYNGWKRISDYSPSGEDNQAYATPEGMPAWYTLNLKLSYQVNKFLNVEGGVENILDQNYRKFASGISSPGRNFIVALRGSF